MFPWVYAAGVSVPAAIQNTSSSSSFSSIQLSDFPALNSPSLILHLNSNGLKFGVLLCGSAFLWVHLESKEEN